MKQTITVYDKLFGGSTYNILEDTGGRQYNYVLNLIKQYTPKSVMDIGSGRGIFIRMLNEMHPDIKISTCDLNNYHRHHFADFQKINLCEDFTINGQYDFVSCLDCLEHLEIGCIDNVIKKISLVTKDIAVFSIANHSDIIDGIQLHLIREDHRFWTPVIEKYFSVVNYEEALDGRLMYYILKTKYN
jgi:hypothetical protein